MLLLYTAPSGPTPGAEASAFLARTSGLDTTHTNAYINLINGLVTDTVWATYDALWVLGTQNETTALLNLVSTSYNLTKIGSPPFVTDAGYSSVSNSAVDYLDPTVNLSTTSGLKYVRNSAHMSFWYFTDYQVNTAAMGSFTSGVPCYQFAWHSSGAQFLQVNTTAAVSLATNRPHAVGLNHPNRSAAGAGSTSHQIYINGVSQTEVTPNTDVAPPNAKLVILTYGNSPTAVATTATATPQNQVAMASFGSSMSTTQALAHYTRLNTFFTATRGSAPPQ